jgi:hypothetical protein
MGDDFDRDDPHIGPDHLPGPDVGGSLTFDFDGHLQSIDIDVPGTAEGSDPAHIEFGGDPATPPGIGWMPHVPDANAPVVDPFSLPPRPGWHRDPITGVEFLDQPNPPAEAGGGSGPGDLGPGDYPGPNPDETVA